jgi:hypothetical protein
MGSFGNIANSPSAPEDLLSLIIDCSAEVGFGTSILARKARSCDGVGFERFIVAVATWLAISFGPRIADANLVCSARGLFKQSRSHGEVS